MIDLGLDEPLPPQDVINDLCVNPRISPFNSLTVEIGTKYIFKRSIPRCPSFISPVFSQL